MWEERKGNDMIENNLKKLKIFIKLYIYYQLEHPIASPNFFKIGDFKSQNL